MKRILIGLLCIPLSLFTLVAFSKVPILFWMFPMAAIFNGIQFLGLALGIGLFWILPGLWLLYGYVKAFLRRPLPMPWQSFWWRSASINATYVVVSTISWLRWGYRGEPIGPVIDPLLIWLPLDGGLVCLWQLFAAVVSALLALFYSNSEPVAKY